MIQLVQSSLAKGFNFFSRVETRLRTHALTRMAHAFLVGNHDEYPQAGSSNVRLRGTEKQLIKESAAG